MMEMLITRIWNFPPVLPLLDSHLSADEIYAQEQQLHRAEKDAILHLENVIRAHALLGSEVCSLWPPSLPKR